MYLSVGCSRIAALGSVSDCEVRSCPETFSRECFRGGRLIELGAGVAGIPGIVAAQLGCFREVLITGTSCRSDLTVVFGISTIQIDV